MKLIRQYLFGCLLSLLVCLTAAPSWAAISYVGSQTGGYDGTASTTDVTFSLTGGSDVTPAAGDLVVTTLCTTSDSDDALTITDTAPVAYTQFGTELFSGDGNDTNMRTAYKVMGGTPDTVVRLGPTGHIDDVATYAIHVFRDVHATPLEQAVQQGTGIDTHIVNPGSITPTTAGTVVYVAGCGGLAGDDGAVFTSSDLTAFRSTYRQDVFDGVVGAGYFEWTSGAFSPATFGGGGTDSTFDSYAWKIVALAPAEAPASAVDAGNAGAIMLLLGR